jgi:hypothetical protein
LTAIVFFDIITQITPMEIAMQPLIDFVPVKTLDDTPESYFVINGVYLYGELEEEQGSELCATSQNILFMEDGIYDVTFKNEEGYVLYLWKHTISEGINVNRGIICKINDLSACTHAKECFNSKKTYV